MNPKGGFHGSSYPAGTPSPKVAAKANGELVRQSRSCTPAGKQATRSGYKSGDRTDCLLFIARWRWQRGMGKRPLSYLAVSEVYKNCL
ncbi:hypothetical protein [Dendronalium sp. ChiSLP03b]|uniref:hypothetical protein n=1 Tax=Dendronalium sp. ChiSLP03b TaxID=3075381 RepID=UPI002ADA8088|nr:hypothetical protein [Dendronalium sp. ChiSLP03b]